MYSFKHKPLTATVLLALASPVALAQQAPEATLPEIQIQDSSLQAESASTKFTAPLLDTPKTVSIIPQAIIEQRGATSLQEALRSVPGITFNAGEGGTPLGDNLKIRGFDASADVFVDGIRDQGSQARDVFAIDQVEVVMGPGSALGGAGSAGGSVNIITKKPRLQNASSAQVGVGTDNYVRAVADVNQKLTDTSAIRLNVLGQKADVPGRDHVDLSHKGFAGAMAFGLGTPTRINLDYYYFRTNDMPDYSFPYARNAGNTAAAGTPVVVNRNNFYGLVNRDFYRTGADIGTIQVAHDLTKTATIRNTTRYGYTTNDMIVTNPDDSSANVPNGFVRRSAKSRNSNTTTLANVTELFGSFQAAEIKNTYNFGFEIDRTDTFNRGYAVLNSLNTATRIGTPVPGTGNAVTANANSCSAAANQGAAGGYNCTTLANPNPLDPWTGVVAPAAGSTDAYSNARSFWAFDTMEFNPQWSLNVGLRHDHYFTQSNATTYVIPGTTTAVANAVIGAPSTATATYLVTPLSNESNFWNYQVGLVYKPAPNGSVYISTATSANPSGLTLGDGTENIAANNQSLDPEKTRTVEVGTKWELLQRKLTVATAIFHTEKTNARVTGPVAGTLILAGNQKVDGIDISVTGNITDDWQVFGGYTRLNSEVSADPFTPANTGKEFPNTPKNSFSLTSNYTFGPWMIGGSAFYVDKRYGNAANTVWVDSYWRFDAMGSYTVSKDLSLQLNVLNLTDKVYFDRPFTTHYATIAPARSAVLSASYKF